MVDAAYVKAFRESLEWGRIAIYLVGAIGILVSTNAKALDGVTLYQWCQAKPDTAREISCIAYVHGFLDGVAFGHRMGKNYPTLYCPPKDGISVVQGRLIIEKYLKNHPEKLHTEAGSLVFDALIEAFHCSPR
jgi:hypothetical protein